MEPGPLGIAHTKPITTNRTPRAPSTPIHHPPRVNAPENNRWITAFAGVVVFALRGEVDVGYAALVGLPAAVGALAGTSLQQRVRTSTLTYGFALLLAVVGVVLLTT